MSWIKGHLAGCTQRCYNILRPDPHFLSQSRSRDQTFWLGLKAKILASTSTWRPKFQYQPVWAKILVLFLLSKVWSRSWSQDWSQPWFRSQRFGLKTLVSRLWSQPWSPSQRFGLGLSLETLVSAFVTVSKVCSRSWSQDFSLNFGLSLKALVSLFTVIGSMSVCSAHGTFRVSSATDSGRSHSLQANDELDKRHWLQCIDDALSREVLPLASAKVRRHSSDVSSTDTLSADFQSPGTSHEDCSASSAATYEENVESCSFNAVEKLPPVARSLQVTNCIFEEL